MSDKAFRITFRGEIEQGRDPDQVKKNVRGLFKLDANNQQHLKTIDRLFSGRTVIIKDGINKTTAQTYADALTKAGAKAYIKIKIGPPDGIEERRVEARRKRGDRRAAPRLSAILPSRRKNNGRRDTDLRL